MVTRYTLLILSCIVVHWQHWVDRGNCC